MPSFSLRCIAKRFGNTHALDDVSVEFAAGEVHALLGENGAGKSTLMNVAYGLIQPDAGDIVLDGVRRSVRTPLDARRAGIGMVHQEFSLIDNFSVLENLTLALGDPASRRIDLEAIERAALELAKRTGLEIGDLHARAGDLAVGARQRIEILEALAGDTRVLILDEPTAVLTPAETAQLFAVLDKLRRAGTAIVFITHKLAEVMAIADRITVLRRGRLVATRPRGEVDAQRLAEMMIQQTEPRAAGPPPEVTGVAERPRLVVHGVEVRERGRPPQLASIGFEIGAGEIFGIAGVDGNGQAELFEVLVGLRPCTAGRIFVDGEDVTAASVQARLHASMSWVPPDRQRQGLVRSLSVRENVLLHEEVLGRVRSGPLLPVARTAALAAELVRAYDVRCSGVEAPAASLSGGNQQRLIVARSLATAPAVLVAFNPTRGLDIGAAEAVYAAFRDAARQGTAILLISTDLDEVFELSHHVAVLYRGRLSPPMPRPAPVERVGRLMAGAE